MDVVRLEEYYKRLFPISTLLKWLGFGPSDGMTLKVTRYYQKPIYSPYLNRSQRTTSEVSTTRVQFHSSGRYLP